MSNQNLSERVKIKCVYFCYMTLAFLKRVNVKSAVIPTVLLKNTESNRQQYLI